MTEIEILNEIINTLRIQRNCLLQEVCEIQDMTNEEYLEDLKQLDAEIDEIRELHENR